MEPRFHTGDLALVRPASEYRVGDIVAYRSPTLRSIVLHRIVARHGDRYTFKGDNNNFVDPGRLERDELVGRLWVRVPRAGAVLAWLQVPLVAGLLCGGVGLLLLVPARRKRRRRGRRDAADGARSMSSRRTSLPPDAQLLVGVSVVVAAICLVVGLLAWTRPAASPSAEKVAYTQKARFSYRADAPAGDVYPDGSVRTGDPIFLRLVRSVRVKIAYRFVSGAPSKLSGTQEVRVRLTSPTGWTRTMRLEPPTAFSQTSTDAWVTLDLGQLRALINRVETLIGAPAGAPFTVDVLPRVRVKGTLAGEPLATTYAPALSFQLDALQLRPGGGGAGASTATTGRARSEGFAPSSTGSVTAAVQAANYLRLPGLRLTVGVARWLALLGLWLAVIAVLLTLAQQRRRPTDPSMRIHHRYGHLIVPIASIIHDPAQPVIDVTSIEALAQVAERSERVILHHHRIGAETYLVDDDGTLFRYQPRTQLSQDAAAA